VSTYLVTDAAGNEVKTGSTLTDFRGDKAIFMQVTRGVEHNGTAKVLVHAHGALTGREYYARVFGLRVVTLESL
jgi:triacylglycerol esterase/lipase EstA (alpha/beta hydrolase family)